jgi:hypothetical protein
LAGAAAKRGGTKFALEVAAGDEEAVEDAAGALVVDLIGGDEGENLGEGELDAGAVVDGGQLKDRLAGVDALVARGGPAGGVVVLAELLTAQGGRAAPAARSVDVTAEITLDGDLGEFGGVGHGVLPWVKKV